MSCKKIRWLTRSIKNNYYQIIIETILQINMECLINRNKVVEKNRNDQITTHRFLFTASFADLIIREVQTRKQLGLHPVFGVSRYGNEIQLVEVRQCYSTTSDRLRVRIIRMIHANCPGLWAWNCAVNWNLWR